MTRVCSSCGQTIPAFGRSVFYEGLHFCSHSCVDKFQKWEANNEQ